MSTGRRRVLKALGAAALAKLAPGELFATARSLQARIEADANAYVFETLDAEQAKLVAAVSELILPETEIPGAKAARVDAFVDLLLAEWFTADERRRFVEGLGRLSADGFVGKPEAEKVRVVEALEREALSGESRRDGQAASSPADAPFFSVIKWLTLYGYFTSEIGMKYSSGHVIFHGSYEGCAPLRA